MVNGFGVHGTDEAEVVGNGGDVRQELAHPRAASAVLRELEVAGLDRQLLASGHGGEPLAHADGIGKLLTAELLQHRLVIEEIVLGGSAGLCEVNDALRSWREVRSWGRGVVGSLGLGGVADEGGEGGEPDAGTQAAKQLPSGKGQL